VDIVQEERREVISWLEWICKGFLEKPILGWSSLPGLVGGMGIPENCKCYKTGKNGSLVIVGAVYAGNFERWDCSGKSLSIMEVLVCHYQVTWGPGQVPWHRNLIIHYTAESAMICAQQTAPGFWVGEFLWEKLLVSSWVLMGNMLQLVAIMFFLSSESSWQIGITEWKITYFRTSILSPWTQE
jgi:hypothetical protein